MDRTPHPQVTSVERIGTTFTPTVGPFLREIEAAGWPALSYHLTVQAPAEWWLTTQIGALVVRFFPAGYDTRNKERPRYFRTPRAVGFAGGEKVWETSLAEGLRYMQVKAASATARSTSRKTR